MVHAFKLESLPEEIPKKEEARKIEKAGKKDQSDVYVDGYKAGEKYYKKLLRKEAWKRSQKEKRVRELEKENARLVKERDGLLEQVTAFRTEVNNIKRRNKKVSKRTQDYDDHMDIKENECYKKRNSETKDKQRDKAYKKCRKQKKQDIW